MRVDCFEDAPSEWTRKTISDLAVINPRYNLTKGREYPFLEMASVREAFGGVSEFAPRLLDGNNLARYRKDDILFAKITPCAENGKVALVGALPDGEEHGLGSTEFIVLSPKEGQSPEYLFALVSSGAFHRRAVSRMEGSTGRLRITDDVFTKWLLVAVPEDDEQAAIISVLRNADEVIMKAKEELDAARRVKTALIQKAFRRGLEDSRVTVPTRIGPLPEGWKVVRVQDVLSAPPFNGVSPASRPEPPGTPILNVGCVKNGDCNLLDVTFVDVDDQTRAACVAREGDFFVLRGNGNRTYVARGGLLRNQPEEATIFSDKLIRLRFKDVVAERFVPYLWQSDDFLRRLQSKAESGSGLWMISKREIRREWIPLPSCEEQEQIVAAIDESWDAESKITDKVTALERLKRSLMQNLLTGKVRVHQVSNSKGSHHG